MLSVHLTQIDIWRRGLGVNKTIRVCLPQLHLYMLTLNEKSHYINLHTARLSVFAAFQQNKSRASFRLHSSLTEKCLLKQII